jgi:predicted amidophosphoribosyltransferase
MYLLPWCFNFHSLFIIRNNNAKFRPKTEENTMLLACPKCGLHLVHDHQKHCAECARQSSERRMLLVALMLPAVVAVAVVVSGLQL